MRQRQGRGVDHLILALGLLQQRRHRRQQPERVEHVELALDDRPQILGLLPAQRRRHQNALLVDQLDDLGRGHVRMLGQHLEQRHQEHIVDDAALLGHHLLGHLDLAGGQYLDQFAALRVHAALVERAWAQVEIDDAVVGGQQHRIGGAVALLQEHGLLRVQGLERRQHHLRRPAAVPFARRLVVAARRIGEGAIALLVLHQALALDADVMRGERQALGVEPLLVVIAARLDAVQEVERLLAVLVERGQHLHRQPVAAPFLQGLVRVEPEPADHAIDDALVVLAEERLAERNALVAQPLEAVIIAAVEGVDEHGGVAEGAERAEVGVVLAAEVRQRVAAILEQQPRDGVEIEPDVPVLHHVLVRGLQRVPFRIGRRQQRICDRGEAVQRQHARGVDLLIGLLLARPVV